MKDHLQKPKRQEIPFHETDALTMANLIAVLKDRFPELREQILELESDDSLKKDSELEQFIFSFVFNPLLKEFLSNSSDTIICKRLFLFLEEMAQSFDFQVKHILAVDIFGSLSQEELAVVQKYMGPKTKKRSVSMWDREEFEARLKKEKIWVEKRLIFPEVKTEVSVTCWGNGKQAVSELEWRLNFKCDPDTRSFIEEIGNVTINGTSIIFAEAGHSKFGNNSYSDLCKRSDLLRKNSVNDSVVQIMYFAGLHYILHKDGSIKAYDCSSSGPVEEVYTSLAHLVEELIKNNCLAKTISDAYWAVTRRKVKSLIRRNRPELTMQQKDAFRKRIDIQQVSQQGSLCLHYVIEERLPELPEDLDDWGYAFGWPDYANEHDYDQDLLDEVLTPFLRVFLSHDPGDSMVGRHLFYVLEKMAEDGSLMSKLALTVFNSLSTEQLEVAKKYMRPQTRKLLKTLEDYFEELATQK